MKGVIVLDGPDAAGKSTLAAKFKEAHGARVIHLTYRFKDKMFAYQTAALRLALRLAETQLVVIDRHWPSECVYGSVFRGGSKWAQAGRFYDRVLLKHGAIHVLCLPESVEAAVEAHKANLDPDHPYDDTDFKKVVQRYLHFGYGYRNTSDMQAAPREPDYCHDFATCGGVFKERSDWVPYSIAKEGRDLAGFCKNVLAKLHIQRSLQVPAALKFANQNWGGAPILAKWILVTEENTNSFKKVGWPLYDYAGGSLYATEMLASLGVMEHDLVWFNCHDDLTVLDEAFERIQHLPVLALGGEATAFAWARGFKTVFCCNSPDYALRHKNSLVLPLQEQFARGIRK
jgi:thymidylate kinase